MRFARSQCLFFFFSFVFYFSHVFHLLVNFRSLVDICIDVDFSFAFDDDSHWIDCDRREISKFFIILYRLIVQLTWWRNKFDDREFRIMWLSIFVTFQNKLVFDFLRKFLRIVNNDCIFEEFDDFVDFLKNFLMSESFFVQRRRRQNIEDCFRLILANNKEFRDRIKRNDHNKSLNRDANE